MTVWKHLRELFQDNRSIRRAFPLFLPTAKTSNHANKLLSFDNPIFDECLFIQLVSGLSCDYNMVATVIEQSIPLPSFTKA
ncbi:hypothetical protein Ccrd_002879 [Cynara cardunculus var. scolymus]|uniref:Uncharacterized protein n=1 Tax=Cynara cardunculus var. scolymus TaxID=59895 RepID=A0A118JWU6_CYNCS|nr:hypothetical protein Ccrd_002879 [Cynara cardunculus var. scolymus]